MRILSIWLTVAVAASAAVGEAEEGPPADRFAQARALYEDMPTTAAEIIALLNEELAENPGHEKAAKLLGITYFSSGEFELALQQVEAVLEAADDRGLVSPRMLFLKAATLFNLGEYAECRRILRVYHAFWQSSDLLPMYEELYQRVQEKLEEPEPAEAPPAGTGDGPSFEPAANPP